MSRSSKRIKKEVGGRKSGRIMITLSECERKWLDNLTKRSDKSAATVFRIALKRLYDRHNPTDE